MYVCSGFQYDSYPTREAAYDTTIWRGTVCMDGLMIFPIYEGRILYGYYTPHTFTGLIGTHFYQVLRLTVGEIPFIRWNTGATVC